MEREPGGTNPETPPNVSVIMVHRDLRRVPHPPLPDGYRFRPYRDGDVPVWVRIQQAAETFFVPTAATFAETLPGDADYLARRVLFLVAPDGDDIGTITAWDDDAFEGRRLGHIHWVAIVPDAQGRGLAKPLLGAACRRLREHGFNEAYLETGTGRIAALNLYLRSGFVPHPRDDAERAAWRAVAPRLKAPLTV